MTTTTTVTGKIVSSGTAVVGASVSLYLATRFSGTPPQQNTAVPGGGADFGPASSASDGTWSISSVSLGYYWLAQSYGGVISWTPIAVELASAPAIVTTGGGGSTFTGSVPYNFGSTNHSDVINFFNVGTDEYGVGITDATLVLYTANSGGQVDFKKATSTPSGWDGTTYARITDAGALLAGSGTSSLPGLAFLAQPALGFYRSAAGVISTTGHLSPHATTTDNLGSNAARWNMIYGAALDLSGAATITGALSAGASTLGATSATSLTLGTPLADAYVADALTISLGTVDGTPIGNSSRSTGKFTTVDATTALQLSGTDINTSPTLSNVAYLDYANLFTARQTITQTSEPLRLRYDASNYTSFVVDSTGNLTMTASGLLIRPGTNNSFRTPSYTSGLVGWNIAASGDAEFNNVTVRGELRASVFKVNEIAATAGTLGVFYSATTLYAPCTTPGSTGSSFTFDAKNSDVVATAMMLGVGDIIRMKAYVNSGGLIIGDAWATITARTNHTTYTTYTATLNSGSVNATFPAGVAIADYGPSGTGFITMSADGTIGSSPNLTMATHSGTPWSGFTPLLREGDLNGGWGYSSATYGWAAGQYGVAGQPWITIETTNGIRIGSNTTVIGQWDTSGNITVGQVGLGNVYVQASDGSLHLRAATTQVTSFWSAAQGDGTYAIFRRPINFASTGGFLFGGGTWSAPTSGFKLYMASSTTGRLAGYNGAGVEQFAVDTDGRFKAASGNVILDASGITVTGAGYLHFYDGLNAQNTGLIQSGSGTLEVRGNPDAGFSVGEVVISTFGNTTSRQLIQNFIADSPTGHAHVELYTSGLTLDGFTLGASGVPSYMLDVRGTLGATGAATLGSTLNVTGAAVFSSTISSGAINASGNSTLANLEVTGNLTVDGSISYTSTTTGSSMSLSQYIEAATDIATSGSFAARFLAGDNGTGSGGYKQILFGWNGGTNYQHSLRTRHDSTAAATNAIDFYLWRYGTDSAGTIGTLRVLTLTNVGVGIFQSNPAYALDVTGAINATGALTTGSTINGASISGGTLSGGTFSAGTVSGGSLSATAVNGLTVSGGTITGGTWNGTSLTDAYVDNDITLNTTKRITALLTTEQFRASYDASNYAALTVASNGDTTLALKGSTSTLTLTGIFAATSIQNTPIGSTTAASGRFTTLTSTGAATLDSLTLTNPLLDASVDNDLTINSTKRITALLTTEQWRVSYDASNYLAVTVASNGDTTLALKSSAATATLTGILVATSLQNTPIGSTTRSTIAATTIDANSTLHVAGAVTTDTTIVASGRISSLLTTEQFRASYDASNYLAVTVASNGDTALALKGASSTATLTGIFVATSIQNTPIGATTAASGRFSTLTSTGAATLDSLGVTNNATVGGTLGVTGATTLGGLTAAATSVSTLASSALATLNSLSVTNNATVGGTLGVTGLSTLASLAVTNNATVGGTLGITGATTAAAITASGLLTLNNQLQVTTTTSPQENVRYDASNRFTVGVGSTGHTTLTTFTGATGGDLIFAPVSNNVLPTTAYSMFLGSDSKRLLAIYAAELQVQNLVTTDTQITTNGRLIVGPSTELIADVSTGATTIDVKLNNLNSADRIRLETGGKFEMMAVTSGASVITGGYRYSVTRDLDGTGANAWTAGDAILNTGQTGNGYIDEFSLQSSQTLNIDYIFPFVYTSGGTPFETGTYSANQSALTTPILWAGHAVNDAIYYGMANTTWANVYMHLATAAVYTGGALAVEYWNGSAWTAIVSLTVVGTGGMTGTGLYGLEWVAASQTGWAAKTINSVSAYWVRLRWSTAPATWTTAPASSARRIYRAKYQYGPTIAFYKRNSSTWNDVSENVVAGNLMGFYGYSVDTPGFGAGTYANGSTFLTVDPTNGLRFLSRASSVDSTLAQFTSSALTFYDPATPANALVTLSGGQMTYGIAGGTNNTSYTVLSSTGMIIYKNTGGGASTSLFSVTTIAGLSTAVCAPPITFSGGISGVTGGIVADTISLGATRPTVSLLYSAGSQYGRFLQSSTTSTDLTHNLSYDGSNWNLDATGTAGARLAMIGGVTYIYAASAGSNPRTPVIQASFQGGGIAVGTTSAPSTGYILDVSASAVVQTALKVGSTAAVTSGYTLDTVGKFRATSDSDFGGTLTVGSNAGAATGLKLDVRGAIGTTNATGYYGADTGGTYQLMLRMAADNNVYAGNFKASSGLQIVAGGSSWLLLDANGGLQVLNTGTTPGTPTGGPILWAASGALKGKGTSGTTTTIAAANPHCPRCGADFALEWENERYGGHFAVCMPCLVTALTGAGISSDRYMIPK